MTEMFGEAWSPMSVPDLAPDDDDDDLFLYLVNQETGISRAAQTVHSITRVFLLWV